jgi:hypothetical protein
MQRHLDCRLCFRLTYFRQIRIKYGKGCEPWHCSLFTTVFTPFLISCFEHFVRPLLLRHFHAPNWVSVYGMRYFDVKMKRIHSFVEYTVALQSTPLKIIIKADAPLSELSAGMSFRLARRRFLLSAGTPDRQKLDHASD